jgi:hypothetical protein
VGDRDIWAMKNSVEPTYYVGVYATHTIVITS